MEKYGPAGPSPVLLCSVHCILEFPAKFLKTDQFFAKVCLLLKVNISHNLVPLTSSPQVEKLVVSNQTLVKVFLKNDPNKVHTVSLRFDSNKY